MKHGKTRTWKSVDIEEIENVCTILIDKGFSKTVKLKGKNQIPSTYFRYTPKEVIETFQEYLPWDTRYIGGNQNTYGRTVVIFQKRALSIALDLLRLDSWRYICTESIAEKQATLWKNDKLFPFVNDIGISVPASKDLIEGVATSEDRKTQALVLADFLEEHSHEELASELRCLLK